MSRTFPVRAELSKRSNVRLVNHNGEMAKQLNPGDAFPHFKVPIVRWSTLSIPSDLKGDYAVIIFYRGIW